MPLFKVSNNERTTQKLVVASSHNELLSKCLKKFNLEENSMLKIVLDNDGSLVEEDEEIIELPPSTELMILLPGQQYALSTDNNLPEDELTDYSKGNNDTGILNESLRTELCTKIATLPLPKFSSIVTTNKESIPSKIWRPLVNETAYYYHREIPGIGESSHYQTIGEKIYRDYPCIGLPGSRNPWTSFSKCVAQKIRHIRHNSKKTEGCLAEGGERKKFKSYTAVKQTNVEQDSNMLLEEELKHAEELKKEYEKRQPNKAHIKLLLKTTSNHFNRLLLKNPGGQIQPILEEFPCFEDGEFILYKMSLLFGVDKIERTAAQMRMLLLAIESILDKDKSTQDDNKWRAMEIVKYIERECCKKRDSVVEVINDLDGTNTCEKAIKTKRGTPLHIKIICNGDDIQALYICGDSIAIRCGVLGGGVLGALLKLIFAYYIFDINFPKIYSSVLIILQEIVMEEKVVTTTTSQKIKIVLKNIKDKIQTVKNSK